MTYAAPPQRGGTRERLLKAAIELIAEAGWGGVTTRAVAERAGVNQALVHYHYRSVPGLLREAAYAAMSATFEPLMLRLVEAEDPVAALRGMVGGLTEIDPDAPESRAVAEATVQAVRDPELGAQVRQMLALSRQELAQRLAAAQTEGHLATSGEPAALATALVGLLDGLALHRLIDPELDVRAASAAVLALLGVAQ
ncbi:MAG: TetR/AcrR family transcriptional regulator [Mycobacterium sp.]